MIKKIIFLITIGMVLMGVLPTLTKAAVALCPNIPSGCGACVIPQTCGDTGVCGNTCYYGQVWPGCSWFTCQFCFTDPNKPACSPYTSGTTCYYGGSPQCVWGGWTCSYSSSCSICSGKATGSCTASGCSNFACVIGSCGADCAVSKDCKATDTDGGNDIYTQGTCTGKECSSCQCTSVVGNGGGTDFCVGTTQIHEYYPDPNPVWNHWCTGSIYNCPSSGCCDPYCSNGACSGTGTPNNAKCADDGLACTNEVCQSDCTCSHRLKPGYCVIAGVCYTSGDTNPSNPCQYCDPSQNYFRWSNKPDGTSCGTQHCSDSSSHTTGDETAGITANYKHYAVCSSGNCVWSSENCDNYDDDYLVGVVCRQGDIYNQYKDYECVPIFGNTCAWTGDYVYTLKEDCVDTCSDSDGKTYTTAGTVTDKNLCSSGQTSCPADIVKTDECLSSTKLREYYCSGNNYAYEDYECTNLGSGYTCSNGRCVPPDQCNSNADCNDNNPCTTDTCNNPAAPDSTCSYTNVVAGTSCGVCKACDGSGNCVNRPNGYNDCGTGCQRCVSGSCQDYNPACSGTTASCYCSADSCIACSSSGCCDATCSAYTCGLSPNNANCPSGQTCQAGCTCSGVDNPPSCSVLSITESSAYAYSPGTTVWYNTLSTGSFTVNVATSDDKGISKVSFPTTVSVGGSDTTSPYSWNYNWDTTDTYSGTATVTAYDTISQTGTCSFTVTRDVTAPTTTASIAGSYTITLSCSDNVGGSGCDKTYYCTDTTNTCSPSTQYTGGISTSCASCCYVRYYSIDRVSNQESTKSTQFGPTCGCVRANPSVVISPSPQSASAGSTLTYTVSVTNNDNAACGSSTFGLSVTSCPSGWTCSLSKSSVTVSPGNTDSSTAISITSPSTATAETYTFKVRATNNAESSYWGEGSGDYTIPAPACSGTLSVSLTGSGTCTVTASLAASNCDSKSWQIRDDGNIKCSGTVSGGSYSYTCPSWQVNAGAEGTTYTYKLYIGGNLMDSKSATCSPGCSINNICEVNLGENQANCPDCKTVAYFTPSQNLLPGQQVAITVYFNDSRWHSDRDASINLTIDGIPWSQSDCPVQNSNWTTLGWQHQDTWSGTYGGKPVRITSYLGYAKLEANCSIPALTSGTHYFKARPTIYSEPTELTEAVAVFYVGTTAKKQENSLTEFIKHLLLLNIF